MRLICIIMYIGIIIIGFLSVVFSFIPNCKTQMAPKVERLDNIESLELGEGPHWHQDTQSLYFVDIFGKAIHKYVPVTKKHTKAVIGEHTSIIIPIKDQKDKFLISIGRELASITWDGESETVSDIKKLYKVDNETEVVGNRFNDGKCDPSGRLWAGTMGAEPINGDVAREKGSLFSFQGNKVTKHLSKIGISNGLAWNRDLNKLYYIDSHKNCIEEYDFDITNGIISNGKPVFNLANVGINGAPDGMAIDTEGNLWVAVFFGYKVIKIDPRRTDTLLQSIAIPAKEVTSVAFGGPNLDELYVTSARFTIDDEVLEPPEHGGTYRITGINATGYPGVSVIL